MYHVAFRKSFVDGPLAGITFTHTTARMSYGDAITIQNKMRRQEQDGTILKSYTGDKYTVSRPIVGAA